VFEAGADRRGPL